MKYEDAVKAGNGMVCRYVKRDTGQRIYADNGLMESTWREPIVIHDATVETHPDWDKYDDWEEV